MLKEYKNIIEAICSRFDKAISELDVIIWLENFDSSDWKKALILLNNFEYFGFKDILKEFKLGLTKIREEYKNEKIYIIGVGKNGKSGASMTYYINKVLVKNKITILLEENDYSVIEENSVVLLVDDFAGTGGSIVDFYTQIKPSLPQNHSTIALTVAFMTKAKIHLQQNKIEIYGNERSPSFSPRGSVFGYKPRMLAIRAFSFKYGNLLYSFEKYKKGLTEHHPLGFMNTQALIGFEHSIPNNTLPIIWFDGKINGTNKKWNPLFPRRGNFIVDQSTEFKNSTRYWASIIYKLELENKLFTSDELYKKETIQLLSLIFLKRKKKSELVICQTLSINLNEYNRIEELGIQKGLLAKNGILTSQALNIYEEFQKKIKFQKDIFASSSIKIEEDILYTPKTFRGSS